MTRQMWAGALAAALVVPIALAAVLWSRDGAGASAPSRELAAGRQLYVTHCAVCHGEGGQGDGPSAAGFASKPSNLSDGRLMNGLPDAFIVNIILNGGPAEGLSPGMPPFAAYLSEAQARDITAYVRSLASPPFRPETAPRLVEVPGAPRQPILFSHLIHSGSFKIDCLYCHTAARRSEYAGLPSVAQCLGCHKIIGAQDNPEIAKIGQYASRGEPIPWVRVFKVPEFTYFPHKPHVRAEIACQTCHGPIEQMRVVGAPPGPNLLNDLANLVGFRPPPPTLSMGWCIDCHRRENATRNTQAPLECIACHH